MKNDQLLLLGAEAEEYIKAHLSEKLDRDRICKALSTNRTTLSKALILRTGRTLKRFVLDERIKKSKELILSGEDNMGSIAEKCGFGDASYFSGIFCKYMGMPPSSYLKSDFVHKDAVWSYRFDGDTLPILPCVHDCGIGSIDSDGEYLSIHFDDGSSHYEKVSHVCQGAIGLTVRYHLCDPCCMIYRQFRKEKNDGQGYEIGYLQYDDEEEFYKASSKLKLYYLNHCIGYNTVMLKLWCYGDPYEILLEFNADAVEYHWNFEADFSGIIGRMAENGIQFENGMSEQELNDAQSFFGFTFPSEIKAFLRCGVPVAEHFFDYRDLSDENLEKFKGIRSRIEQGFSFDIMNVPYFLRKMERRYGTMGAEETLGAIMAEYENSPKLIPFYSIRCFFDGLDGMPIISYSQPCDMIIYGENFEEYLKKEFCAEKVESHLMYSPQRIMETGIWWACIRTEFHVAAHDHCGSNLKELKNSQKCGCFYCLNIFSPQEIRRWIDNGQTALCPHCQIDSVIGDASGYSITKEFLKVMRDYWFSPVEDVE